MKLPIAALGFVLGSAFFFLAGSVYSQEPSSQSPISPTPQRLRTLGQQPDDGPVIMLNLLKFKPDGGRAAYGRYGAIAIQQIRRRGGEILYGGEVAGLLGPGSEWEQVVIVKYPSRAAFLDMSQDPEYLQALPHRDEGLDATLLYAFRPAEGLTRLDDDGDVPTVDAAGADAYFNINLLRYKGEEGREAYERYTANTFPLIAELGGRPVLRLVGEQPLVGDEEWDELLFIMYPSREAFLGMLQDPDYREGTPDRTAGLDNTLFLPTRMTLGGAR